MTDVLVTPSAELAAGGLWGIHSAPGRLTAKILAGPPLPVRFFLYLIFKRLPDSQPQKISHLDLGL